MDRYLIDLAILPGVALLVYMYNKDEVEKEPLGLLALLFLGGLLSCVTAFLLETGADIVAGKIFSTSTITYAFFEAFLCAGLMEEGSKYVFLNLFSWKNKNFNCTFDGLIYPVFVSLGFAIGENVLYVLESGFETAIARAFTAVPAHMFFSIVMGIFYSKAKIVCNRGEHSKAKAIKRTGLLLSIIVHGLYDFLLMASIDSLYFVWIGLVVILYVFAFITINISSKKDRAL